MLRHAGVHLGTACSGVWLLGWPCRKDEEHLIAWAVFAFQYLTRDSFKKLFYHRIVHLPPGNEDNLRRLKMHTRNQQWLCAILHDFLHQYAYSGKSNCCVNVASSILRSLCKLMFCMPLSHREAYLNWCSFSFLLPTSFFAIQGQVWSAPQQWKEAAAGQISLSCMAVDNTYQPHSTL